MIVEYLWPIFRLTGFNRPIPRGFAKRAAIEKLSMEKIKEAALRECDKKEINPSVKRRSDDSSWKLGLFIFS